MTEENYHYTYLASPYSSPSANIMQTRYEEARRATAFLLRERSWIYSPIVHCHDHFRDTLIQLRQTAAREIWTDKEKFGNYAATADGLESTVNEWWDDPKWTNTDSPFAYLLPDYAKRLLGKTTYVPDYSILESF